MKSENFWLNCRPNSNELLSDERLLYCRSLVCIFNGKQGADSKWEPFTFFLLRPASSSNIFMWSKVKCTRPGFIYRGHVIFTYDWTIPEVSRLLLLSPMKTFMCKFKQRGRNQLLPTTDLVEVLMHVINTWSEYYLLCRLNWKLIIVLWWKKDWRTRF